MTDSLSPLQKKYGHQLNGLIDLQSYFIEISSGEFAGREDVHVNLLSPEQSVALTEKFCEFHPLFEPLQLLILDEANTSNYHCYAPGMPIPGAVVYVSHDGPTKFAFACLEDFLRAARMAIEADAFLTDFHTAEVLLSHSQDQLNVLIRKGFESQEAEEIMLLKLQASDLIDTDLMIEIARDDNFYFGETLAERIIAKPTIEMLPIATACANHPHPQVSNPGEKAVDSVNAIR